MSKYLLINLTIVAFLPCCQTNPASEAGFKENYTEDWEYLKATEYEISYPPAWQLDQSKNTGTAFILFGRSAIEGKFRENINLLVQDLRGLNLNLNEYVALSEQQIETMVVDSKLIESKREKGSNERHQIVYEGVHGPFKLKWKQYYWVVHDKAYVLTFTGTQDTYDDFIKTADKILDSFKLREPVRQPTHASRRSAKDFVQKGASGSFKERETTLTKGICEAASGSQGGER